MGSSYVCIAKKKKRRSNTNGLPSLKVVALISVAQGAILESMLVQNILGMQEYVIQMEHKRFSVVDVMQQKEGQ